MNQDAKLAKLQQLRAEVARLEAELGEPPEDVSWLNRQLQLLHEVALQIDGASDEQLMLGLRMLREVLGMEAAMITRLRGDFVHLRVLEGPDLAMKMGGTFPREGSLTERTANSVMVVAFDKPGDNPIPGSADNKAWPIRSYIGTRIDVDGELYGTLAFASRKPRGTPWRAVDRQLITLVGKWVQRAIELSLHRKRLDRTTVRLQRLATHDSMTSLLNRREVLSRLASEIDRANRYRSPFSIALLDLDHFKRVNDSYGHQAGDAALRKTAGALRQTLRTTDFCGRIGGEEFLIVFPNIGLKEAVRATDRIRAAVESCDILFEGHSIALTTSAGVAQYRADETLKTMIARADHALYSAKKSGRNRVVAAETS